jgi:type IV pilus assembly protein PilX
MKKPTALPELVTNARAHQTGATLIVGLVLLLVLTVVGVSGMNTATMEITMAANTQFQQDAFQQAEDGIDIMIANRMYHPDANRTLDLLGDPDYDRSAVSTPRDSVSNAFGSSVGEIRAFHWDIQSVGQGPRNAISTHNQGFYTEGRATN